MRSGYGKTFWGRLRIYNPQAEARDIGLVLKYAVMDHVDWYSQNPDGSVHGDKNGQLVALDPDLSPSRFPLFPVTLEAGETRDIYLRIRSDTVVILPIRVQSMEQLQRTAIIDIMLYSLLVGCLLTMAALGYLFFTGSRKWAYFWFATFCASIAAHIFLSSGVGKAYVWPGATVDLMFLLFVLEGLAMGSSALFVVNYLDTRSRAPLFHKLLYVIAGFSLLTCLATPLPFWVLTIAFLVSTGIGPLVILSGSIWLTVKKVKGAQLVVLSWIPNQAGIIWTYLRSLDLVPYSDIHHYTMPVTCTLTAIAFT